jgi:polyferredoxin
VPPFENIKLPTNRKFGFFFTSVFASLGSYLLFLGLNSAAHLVLATTILLFLTTLMKADALLPLNKLWAQLGQMLGLFVSPIVLGAIFFGLITPISLLMKIFGRDELRLKLANGRKSHWKERNLRDVQANQFKYQF